jgi:hypothetical protein
MANENIKSNVHSETELLPRPDPTRLTTEQISREIFLLKELIFARIEGQDSKLSSFDNTMARRQTAHENELNALKTLLEVRLDGMDKANILHKSGVDEIPNRVNEKIAALKSIHEEKFMSIQTQFRERDVRAEQSSKDSKIAVDAALQAAKEAVSEQNKSSGLAIGKSETATVKQMDQMNQQITAQTKAIDDKFSDLKDRISRIEQIEAGLTSGEIHGLERKKSGEWSIGMFIAIGTSMVAAILVIFNIVLNVYFRGLVR